MATLLIAGVVALVVFYLLILIVGVTAARCFKVDGSRSGSGSEVRESEEVVVAGRSLHGVVGAMTMIGEIRLDFIMLLSQCNAREIWSIVRCYPVFVFFLFLPVCSFFVFP